MNKIVFVTLMQMSKDGRDDGELIVAAAEIGAMKRHTWHPLTPSRIADTAEGTRVWLRGQADIFVVKETPNEIKQRIRAATE